VLILVDAPAQRVNGVRSDDELGQGEGEEWRGGINVPRADTARSARMHRRRNSRQGDNSRREERPAFTLKVCRKSAPLLR
jgi:hypothetical protein